MNEERAEAGVQVKTEAQIRTKLLNLITSRAAWPLRRSPVCVCMCAVRGCSHFAT